MGSFKRASSRSAVMLVGASLFAASVVAGSGPALALSSAASSSACGSPAVSRVSTTARAGGGVRRARSGQPGAASAGPAAALGHAGNGGWPECPAAGRDPREPQRADAWQHQPA